MSPSPKVPLALPRAGLLATLLLVGCTEDPPGEPAPEEQNVPCRDLETDLKGGGVPPTLSATGLYQDFAARTLLPSVREFTPVHPLWSDSAQKRRFVQLP